MLFFMTEWIINTMNSLRYVGIALLMFSENLFPPIPSELIMKINSFIIYSTVGTLIWVSLLTSTNYILGENYTLIEKYIAPISKITLLSIVFLFVIWVIKKQMKK
ncbi:hypothetical protein Cyan10605_2259 [Cyanobacterium aponinum PCC 10605]|uniref:Uncharacterized protein n=1 Tax=Cyanobacterium aponinum (strain PCC 10605) TaxID=755178 RepID=K9Z5C6_CYAAP|nr:hypothetical protein Cyan10605_2259 [Cyanobacterium aponinum PCC 10605]